MSTEFRQQLRALVDEHHRSLLPTPDYRRRRSELLDRVAAEGIAARPADATPEPVAPAGQVTTQPRPVTPQRADEPAARQAGGSGSRLWLVAGLAAIAAIAAAAWWLLRAPDAGSPSTHVASPPVRPAAGPAGNVLQAFIEQDNWRADDLDWLDDEWRALAADEQIAGKQSAPFRAFARELREQYVLMDAAGAATESSRERLTSLTAIAQTMGIHLGSDGDDLEAKPLVEVVPTATIVAEPVAPVVPAATDTPPAPPARTAPARDIKEAAEKKVPGTGVRDSPKAIPAVLPEPVPEPTATAAPPDGSASSRGCRRDMLSTRRKFCRDRFDDGEPGPKLALIRVKSFSMGGAVSASEQPVHEVTPGVPFVVAVSEVSFAQFRRFCEAVPAQNCPDNPWGDDALPVVNVSWTEAASYATWLGAQLGQRYRLLSESEWEYAARAGSTTAYPFGDDILVSQASFSGTNALERPLAASGKTIKANAFGLVNSVGNVREWVQDNWQDSYDGVPVDGSAHEIVGSAIRVVRGGSYADRAGGIRSSVRAGLKQETRDARTGFRVGRSLVD